MDKNIGGPAGPQAEAADSSSPGPISTERFEAGREAGSGRPQQPDGSNSPLARSRQPARTVTTKLGDLFTIQETATYLQVSTRTVTRLLKSGKLRGHSLSGTRVVRIRRDEIERFLTPLDVTGADLDQFIAEQSS